MPLRGVSLCSGSILPHIPAPMETLRRDTPRESVDGITTRGRQSPSMTDAEAMALTPPTAPRAMMFELPPSSREWITDGDRWRLWLPSVLSTADELDGWDVLAEWDRLAGRLVREVLFGEPGNARKARRDAEAVAAEAERLAVRLGARV